jgi:hypothetical protein
MIKTLGREQSCPKQMPFTMFFAVEPAYTTLSLSKDVLQEQLNYNPALQINDASAMSTILSSTSTSVESSTSTGIFGTDSDSDTLGDESQ